MSELLTKSLAAGKVTIQKRRHVAGEVVLMFHDSTIAPIYLQGYAPVCLTDLKGVTVQTVQKSNLRDLLAKHLIEVV